MAFQFSNEIKPTQLRNGDHIYCYRRLVSRHDYSHHGIFVADSQSVIHFAGNKGMSGGRWCEDSCRPEWKYEGNDGVVRTCVDCFLHGATLRRFRYGVNEFTYRMSMAGSCSVAKEDDASEVVARATNVLQKGFGKYHLLKNNCERFCFHCKTGAVPSDCTFTGDRPFYCTRCEEPQFRISMWGSIHELKNTVKQDGKLYLNGDLLVCRQCKTPLTYTAHSAQVSACAVM